MKLFDRMNRIDRISEGRGSNPILFILFILSRVFNCILRFAEAFAQKTGSFRVSFRGCGMALVHDNESAKSA